MRSIAWPAAVRPLLILAVLLPFQTASHAAESVHPAAELIGTWRGSSVCTDMVAAPACKNETVVYEFSPGAAAGTVHWQADKIVDGKRLSMGEFDLVYNGSKACWQAELTTPRFHLIWSLTVHGAALEGTSTLLPGRQVVRKVDARKE